MTAPPDKEERRPKAAAALNTLTGEVNTEVSTDVAVPTPRQRARALTKQIKVAADDLSELIAEAYTSRTWQVLGYSSWDNYVLSEFGAGFGWVPGEHRTTRIKSLRQQGLSLRAIESVAGISARTIRRALAPVANATPDPHPVIGIDGKTYAARPAESDAAWSTITHEVNEPLPGEIAGRERKAVYARWSRVIATTAEIPHLGFTHIASVVSGTEISAALAILDAAKKFLIEVRVARRSGTSDEKDLVWHDAAHHGHRAHLELRRFDRALRGVKPLDERQRVIVARIAQAIEEGLASLRANLADEVVDEDGAL